MALEPKLSFCQSEDCTQLQVTDNTGTYDAVNNTGGWGAPNVLLANVSSAVAKILLPGKIANQDEITVNLQPQIPSSTFQFKILKAQDFGLATDTKLLDGTYIIDYTVTVSVGSPSTYTYHTEVMLICQKAKCVNDLLKKIAKSGCDCTTDLIDAAVEANTIVCALAHSAECQRPSDVKKISALLDKICKVKNDCLSCE